MHILIVIHILQNGTKWLHFITVVEDNIFPPHDSESYFGTFGHPVFHKLTDYLAHKTQLSMSNPPKMFVYNQKDMLSAHQTQCYVVNVFSNELRKEVFSQKSQP